MLYYIIYIYIYYIILLTLYAFQKMSCIYIKLKDIHKIVIFRLLRIFYIYNEQMMEYLVNNI